MQALAIRTLSVLRQRPICNLVQVSYRPMAAFALLQPCKQIFNAIRISSASKVTEFGDGARISLASKVTQSNFPTHKCLCLRSGNTRQEMFASAFTQQKSRFHARPYQAWEQNDGNNLPRGPLLLRPIIFAAAFVVGSISIAAILKDERLRRTKWTLFRTSFHDFYGWQLTTGQLIASSIIAVNTVVFMCWQWTLRGTDTLEYAPSWLRRNFLHYAFSGRALPLLGSVFSHMTLLHLGFNMIALWSFAPSLVKVFGPENFVALYTSAGVLSSLGGCAIKLLTRCTRPSLGASGALMFLFSSTALIWPHAQFGLIFLPGVAFAAPQMLGGIVCMDLAGLVLGWRMFDHGAHLAGCALGWVMVRGGGVAALVEWQQHVVVWYRRFLAHYK